MCRQVDESIDHIRELENEDYEILWDFIVQTDHVIEAQRLDLIVVDKKKRSCKIFDFVVPGDSRIEGKEKDKIEKYKETDWYYSRNSTSSEDSCT